MICEAVSSCSARWNRAETGFQKTSAQSTIQARYINHFCLSCESVPKTFPRTKMCRQTRSCALRSNRLASAFGLSQNLQPIGDENIQTNASRRVYRYVILSAGWLWIFHQIHENSGGKGWPRSTHDFESGRVDSTPLPLIRCLICDIYTPRTCEGPWNRNGTIGHPFSLCDLRAPKRLVNGRMPLCLTDLKSIA